MKIGKHELKSNLILPAIAGYSDVGFRSLCLEFGAGLAFTEMVSAKGLIYGNKTKQLLHTAINEQIKCVQIFGSDKDIMASSVKSTELEKFDIIDINFGCPVAKIVKNGEGSALLSNPLAIYNIVKEVKKACPEKEVTAKIRIGLAKDNINATEVSKAIEEGGASAVIVHGRTKEQMYAGEPDLEAIKRVKESIKIPVIANGNVVDRESYEKMMEYTGADGVAIARGALGRPFVFSEILGIKTKFSLEDLVRRHIKMLRECLDERVVVNNIKAHAIFYLRNLKNSKSLRIRAVSATTVEQILDCFIINT